MILDLRKPLKIRRYKDFLCEYYDVPVVKSYTGLSIGKIESYLGGTHYRYEILRAGIPIVVCVSEKHMLEIYMENDDTR